MSEFGSSVGAKKRIIIKNPDGSYSHCFKTGEKDSIIETKEANHNANQDNQNDNLTLSDSELQYLVNNYEQFDYCSLIEHLLNEYRRNQIVFVLLLFIELSLSVFLLFVTWKKKESSIFKLQETYRDVDGTEAYLIFYSVFVVTLVVNILFYVLGFVSLITKKVKVFKFFSTYSLYTALLMVFIIYLNILFLLLFILRLIVYGFSRFLVNLLVSILILPRYPVPNTLSYGAILQNQ